MNGTDGELWVLMWAVRRSALKMNALDFLCRVPSVQGTSLGKHLSTSSTYELTH